MEVDMLAELVNTLTRETINKVMLQREEILTAFIAKYGCEPDEIVQVVTLTPTGSTWTIERKKQSL